MVLLAGKTIVVTGGAQGIGRGITEALLDAGAAVVIADCDCEATEELLELLAEPQRLLAVPTDVGNEAEVAACMAAAVNRFGAIDGLVNNAGIADPGDTPLEALEREVWERILRTNLTGCFLMVKHGAPHLRKRHGAIVNISSTRALQSEPHTEAYSASKGGLLSLTHAMAVSLGSDIRVNAILPGWIDVGPYRKRARRRQPVSSPTDHRQHPVGRIGVPHDIGALTTFLLSEDAGFITGQGFVVDGGMTRKMIYLDET